VAEDANIRFERKQTLALKGVDGQLRETTVTTGPRQRRAGKGLETEIEIAQIGAGAMFGELALIDGLPRTASAVALATANCVAISPNQLDTHLAEASPELSQRLRLLLAFVRAVPARATWPDGKPPQIPSAELVAVHEAVTAGSALAKTEANTAFLRALYQTMCAYALARFP